MIHYLPGCDVKKNHPEAITVLQNYLEQQGVVIDKCCRVKEKFLQEGDIIINNCTLCSIILKETHPNNLSMSLYEYLLSDENFPWVDYHQEKITIQDCLRTKDDKKMLDAIRMCLNKMNYQVIEMADNYEKSVFCGVWRYNRPAQDCFEVANKTFSEIEKKYIQLLPEDKQIEKMQERVKQYPTENVLVYCNGCERGLKLGGKQPIHLVELLAKGLMK